MLSKSLCWKVVITTPEKAPLADAEAEARFLVVGGIRVCTNSVLLPSALTCALIKLRKPAPADKTKITVEIPITIPKVVNAVRAGLERRALMDCLNALNIEGHFKILAY